MPAATSSGRRSQPSSGVWRKVSALARAKVAASGFKKLDMSAIPPIVTRGVLIDMAKHFGKPLAAGHAFTAADLQAALKAQKLTVGKGDVVLLHTGWMAAKLQSDRAAFNATEPGLGHADRREVVRRIERNRGPGNPGQHARPGNANRRRRRPVAGR